MGRRGLGGTQQQVLSPACQSLLHHLTRLSSEPRRAPTLPVGKAGIWGTGRRRLGGGQAEACPPQGNQHSLHLPTPPPPTPSPRIPLRRTATGDHRGEVRGEGMEEREKILEEEGLHSLTHSFCAYSPHSLLYSHSNTGSWGLRAEARGRGHWGFSVTRVLGGRWDGGWEQGGGTLSQSLPLQALSHASCSPHPEGSWLPDLSPPALS